MQFDDRPKRVDMDTKEIHRVCLWISYCESNNGYYVYMRWGTNYIRIAEPFVSMDDAKLFMNSVICRLQESHYVEVERKEVQ